MRDLSELWSRVVRYLPEPLILCDATDGRCVDANPAAAALMRTPTEALRGCHLTEFAPRSQPDGSSSRSVIDSWARLTCSHEHVMPWTIQRASGEELPVELRMTAVPGAPDQRLWCLRLVERPHDQPRGGAAPLDVANRELLETSRQRSMFLSSVSHELRSPLHTIIGFSELLVAGQVQPGTPEHQESLLDILQAGRSLLQQIDDILALAATEGGHLELHPEPLALEALIREVADTTRALAPSGDVHLDFEFDAALAEVTVDPLRLRQIVFNYLANAFRHVPAGGHIVVRTIAEGPDWFRVEVEDSGVGIAPSELNRLFAEVATVPGSRLARGTGFGLALTRRLVEAHGGSVGARSQPRVGSVFHARLPRQLIAAGAAAAPGGRS